MPVVKQLDRAKQQALEQTSDLYAALCVSTFQKILRELRPGSGEILRGTKSRNCAQIHVLNKFTIGMCGCKEKNAKNSLFL